MENNFDEGMRDDFDNMTADITGGRKLKIYPRNFVLDRDGRAGSTSGFGTAVEEIIFLQELNSEHEMVTAGQLNVGDVRFKFQSNSIAEEEGKVEANGNDYKILKLSKIRGMATDVILEIRAYGKKIPNR